MLLAVGGAVDDQNRGWRLSFHAIDVALLPFVNLGLIFGSIGVLHIILHLVWLRSLVIVLYLFLLDILCLTLFSLGLGRCRFTSPSSLQLIRTRSRL